MKKSIEDRMELPQEQEFRVNYGTYQIIGRFQGENYIGNEALIQVARSYAARIFIAHFVVGFTNVSRSMRHLVNEAITAIQVISPTFILKEGEFDNSKKSLRMIFLRPYSPPILRIRVYGLRGRAKTIYINTSI